MLNSASLRTVNNARFSQRFVRPLYDSYCFSNLPSTIEFLLTGKNQSALPVDVFGNLPTRYNSVIFFFIDAFGWRFFERYAEKYPFLKRFLEQGCVSKMTSQFPSTTAAHVTCIHTGLNVGQSGVYEWNYYEPLVDAIISPLLFSYAGDKLARDTIKNAAVPATSFFPQNTFYQRLKTHGVNSHILQYQAYTPSTYSDIVFRGAQVHPYQTLHDAFSRLLHLITKAGSQPSYYFLYFDRLDAVCHNHGPTSKNFEDSVDGFLKLIDQSFYQPMQARAKNTLFIMTADHGQVEVNPYQTSYINKHIPTALRYIKTNKKGNLLAPAGSARDMFLHVKEECIDEAVAELHQRLAFRAEVYRTEELIRQNFFGMQPPSQTFLDRVGNVVILPYKRETVWWHEEGKFSMHFQGHHGGLTPEEMEIPLLLLPF
ncbi:MAG TPA: alkaline phosphatase family protein [Dictyobacter sp.]|nr:alkaline phosphatase family protein [Dictyobacter sp.]